MPARLTLGNKVNKKIIITIDGFSSSGKSSLAALLAKKLGYKYINTGAMYRAIAYLALESAIVNQHTRNVDVTRLIRKIDESELKFNFGINEVMNGVFLNGKKIDKYLKSMEVSGVVSLISSLKEVRDKLVHIQREMGASKGIAIEGRDLGTRVFPNAELKIYMTADLKVRANRRYKELVKNQINTTEEEVERNLAKRDKEDVNRKESPLYPAMDAIHIDNTHGTLDEEVNRLLELLKTKFQIQCL